MSIKSITQQYKVAQMVCSEITLDQVIALRRCAMTLNRWNELECGDNNDYASFCIERDETTGKPYMCVYPHKSDEVSRRSIPDRETGALKRAKAICDLLGVRMSHQRDPRGPSLAIVGESRTAVFYK